MIQMSLMLASLNFAFRIQYILQKRFIAIMTSLVTVMLISLVVMATRMQ